MPKVGKSGKRKKKRRVIQPSQTSRTNVSGNVTIRDLATGEILEIRKPPRKKPKTTRPQRRHEKRVEASRAKQRRSKYSPHLDKLARASGFRDYGEYLDSPHWKTLRREALVRDKWRCVECKTKVELQVHHVRYGPLLDVPVDWLQTLCADCHTFEHLRRSYEQRKAREGS
jgi:hypothetical protein